MTSFSVDFLLRRKDGNSPFGSHPISTETSATFPRIKAKGRRLVRNLFWHQIFVCFVYRGGVLWWSPNVNAEWALTDSKCGLLCPTQNLHMPFSCAPAKLTKTPRRTLLVFQSTSPCRKVWQIFQNSSCCVQQSYLHFSMHANLHPEDEQRKPLSVPLVLVLKSLSGSTWCFLSLQLTERKSCFNCYKTPRNPLLSCASSVTDISECKKDVIGWNALLWLPKMLLKDLKCVFLGEIRFNEIWIGIKTVQVHHCSKTLELFKWDIYDLYIFIYFVCLCDLSIVWQVLAWQVTVSTRKKSLK